MDKSQEIKHDSDKSNLENYTVLEWSEDQFVQCCRVIINSDSSHIQQIRLDKGHDVYLLTEEYYLAAKSALREKLKQSNK
jgi:hypothetical protein